MRIGMGYDVHRLAENRKMIIGGVEIPYEKGLLGHSDADVLLHADTDAAYEGISSLVLLEKVRDLLEENCFFVENIDATIIAQAPKMRPYIDEMRKNIAERLGITLSQVNVKATTEEGLGFTGNKEGISAQAVCMLNSPRELYAQDVELLEKSRTASGCAGCTGCTKNL